MKRNAVINSAVHNIDNLTYSYTGNQLRSVTDKAPAVYSNEGFYAVPNAIDYDYDHNGNLTFDKNKGIGQIEYNYLNLPKKIVAQNDNTKYIEYIYDANGQKLVRKSPTTTHSV